MVYDRAGMRGLAVIVSLAAGSLLHAQPTINGPNANPPGLQSSVEGDGCGEPTHGAAITAGTPARAICLYVNGNFNVAANSETVTWTDAANPNGLTLNQLADPTATQLVAAVPANLYANAETATITVTENPFSGFDEPRPRSTSNGATFTVNPALAQVASLPSGIVGVIYSQPFFTGGTGPFMVQATAVSPPPGLAYTPNTINPLAGTPTQAGPFTVAYAVTDSWTNPLTTNDSIVIFNPVVIATNALPNGRINTAYTAMLMGSGGSGGQAWGAGGLPTGLSVNAGTGVISGTPTQSGNFTVTVTLADGAGHMAAPVMLSLTIVSTLTILTGGIPPGTVNTVYGATLLPSGGTPPYMWSVMGLPSGLGYNMSTGVISGTPVQSGSFPVSVTLTDNSGQRASAAFGLTISQTTPPPVQIATTSLPNGTVGVFYSGLIGATGGNGGPYTFTATGSLPPGLQVSTTGLLQGTPTAPGTFSFGVTAADSAGNSGSATVSVTIVPAPLVITTGPLGNVQIGSSIGIVFTATGGVPPLSFSLSGTAPAGTALSSTGTLSGTATTAGTYSFTVTVTDSVKNTASKGFTLVVTPPPLTITAPTLPAGQVGVAYAGQFAATGGTPPYTWSGAAGGGLSVSSSGAVSGTPTAAGTFAVSITVTDSLGGKASGSYSVTVNSSSLLITTSSLPNGALTSAYSANLSATGGTPPYTWSASGLPAGITASSSGTLSGTPTSPGAFTVTVTAKDSTGVSTSANLSITILPAPLKITTTGISPPTLGTSFSLAFGATGGTPPYTWSATGLPGGVTLASTGTLSGTPTTVGTSSITVNVKDVNGLQATETLNLTVNLPAAPTLTLTGLPATANPGTQSTATVTFNTTYPVAVTVNLTLTFAPLSGADDPNIQFSTGGRTATLTIPAGATTSSAGIGVQTGTVAGTITITSQLLAAGQDITPVPAPAKTIVIGPGAPTITSATATTSSTGFTVTIDGFDTTRAVTQVVFTFTPVAGSTLQTTTVTVPATSLFSSWYQSSASTAYGSQFSFTIPFTVTGNVQSISSVTVTLVNPTGSSTAVTTAL